MHDLLLPILAAADPAAAAHDSGPVLHFIQQVFGPFGVKLNYLIAQIVNFAIVAFIVYRFAFKPVMATVDERNKRIAEGLQYAEDMKRKLAEARKQHEEILRKASHDAQQIITEARESAKALIEKATQDAARQAEDIVRKGHEAVALEHQKMLADLRREVAGLVVATTGRVLGRDLTPDERSRFAATAASDLSKN